MSLPVGPWVRVVTYLKNDEKEWENVWWYTVSGTPSGGFNIKTFAAALYATYKATLAAPLQTSFASVQGARVYYNNGTYTLSSPVFEVVGGSEVSDELPAEVAAIVRIQSDHGGPSGRGRIFLGGLCDGNTEESKLSAAGLTLYQAFASAIFSAFTNQGLTLHLALYSKKDSVLRPITSVIVEASLGHRTKRRPVF